MSKVIVVPGMSAEKIELEAEVFLRHTYPKLLNIPSPFPVQDFFERDLPKSLGYDYAVQSLPEGVEATTDFIAKEMVLSEGTYSHLLENDGRARFTVLHETGHIVLHANYIEGLVGRGGIRLNRTQIPAYKDPEWQANYFAGAVMMPRKHLIIMLKQGKSVMEIAKLFQASRHAVEIRLMKLGLDSNSCYF